MKSRAICKIELSLIALVKLAVKKVANTVVKISQFKFKNKKILVIAVSHIGDTICCIPALSLLREQYPEHKIDFFCGKAIVQFMKRNPFGVNVIAYDEKDVLLNLRLSLTLGWYNEIYVIWSKRDLLLAQAIGGHRIITTQQIKSKSGILSSFVDEARKVIDTPTLEGSLCSAILPDPVDPNQTKELVFNHYHDKSLWGFDSNNCDNTVFLHPGTLGSSKLWAPKNWNNLAKQLLLISQNTSKEEKKLKVTFSGQGDFDLNLFSQIAPKHEFINCINSYSFDEFAQKLDHCKLLICVDTSTLHLAKLLNINCIVLLGGSIKERIGTCDYYKNFNIHYLKSPFYCDYIKNEHCLNCLIKDCKHVSDGYSECMNNLTVESVVQEVKKILNEQ